MKTIFTALAITAISISSQAVPQGANINSGITGQNLQIQQSGSHVSITGDNIQIGESTTFNTPGSLTIGSRIPSGGVGCGGACITVVSNPIISNPSYNTASIDNGPIATVDIKVSATIVGPNAINALAAREVQQTKTPAIPDLAKLSPASDNHAHPELMNLATVADDTQLSLAQ